jgi:hypothetical protein
MSFQEDASTGSTFSEYWIAVQVHGMLDEPIAVNVTASLPHTA